VAALLNPGGKVKIITGRLVDKAALKALLEQAGFKNVNVVEVGPPGATYVQAIGTL
jgi:hypothetical protein